VLQAYDLDLSGIWVTIWSVSLCTNFRKSKNLSILG